MMMGVNNKLKTKNSGSMIRCISRLANNNITKQSTKMSVLLKNSSVNVFMLPS